MKFKKLPLLLAALTLLSALAGCGDAPASSTSSASAASEPDTHQVAAASEMTAVEDVVEDGMVPICADALADGVYTVEMKSSSSMFKADEVMLRVENGEMHVNLIMSSESYLYMYPGTAAEAAAATQTDYVPLTELEDGRRAFVLPAEALDEGLSYAAFSKKKEKWYDRTLLFRADSLPDSAFLEARYTTPESLNLADGKYTVEVTLSGGSGKASVQSPARLTVENGSVTAEIVWSSPNYDYMVVEGQEYQPVNPDGNSVFEIPVTGFDYPMPVQADTTAMSQPYLIDYTLFFDAGTIASAP